MNDDNLLPFPGQVADERLATLEALLFASGEAVRANALAVAMGLETPAVHQALLVLQKRMAASDRGLELEEIAGGWQLRTDPRHADTVIRLLGGRPRKLSGAALEVLSVVAYQQPATKGEIDRVRGVDSGGVLRKLLERGILRVAGQRDEPGRPSEYATTPAFLELFSLPNLASLPQLRDREAMLDGEEQEE